MDTVAFIPVRGGSKSIPFKNIKSLAGKPLVHWTMEAALACPKIDRLYVASEDPRVRTVASRIADKRLKVIDRDPKTATDEASTESALFDFAQRYEFERVVLIQATSPLLTGDDLTAALENFDAGDTDAMLSVVRQHRFVWKPNRDGTVTAANYEPSRRPRRQDWDGELVENGAFYITSRNALLESRCRVSGKIAFFEMAESTAVELDEPHDWAIAEQLLSEPEEMESLTERCRDIALVVTDVDGVLTDSGVYVGPDGELCKKFSTRDGMGFALLSEAGIHAAIMTSEDSPIVTERAAKLKIERVFLGTKNKPKALKQFLKDENLNPKRVAFIGDDVNDIDALKSVGLAACPADAVDEVKRVAHYVCKKNGGDGCVRELIDLILGRI